MRCRDGLFRALVVVLVFCGSVSAQKLKIKQVVWGFDGKVAPNQFSPVSILLDNQGDAAFDGEVTLRQRSGTRQPIGPRFVERDLYIAATGERWVQFYPYHGKSPELSNWRLSWERGSEELPAMKTGGNALVMLAGSSGLSSGRRGVRSFDEDIFPPFATATHGLGSVILDHVPRWQEARERAFLDWLHLGGQLHLLPAEEDGYPAFSGILSVLNSPQEQQRVGAGTVFRHGSVKVDSKFPERLRRIEKAARLGKEVSLEEDELDKATQAGGGRAGYSSSSIQFGWDAATRAHVSLKQITHPDHHWPLIYLLSFLYILIIFPGCYLVGKRKSNYLFTYGAILGAAGLFSLAFLYVGRRGYGEETAVHSVAVAQQIEGDRWDVTQWSNAFVTSGNTYSLLHSGDGVIYAADQEESVRGDISKVSRDDKKTTRSFSVDIPPFSNRPFVHKQIVKLPTLGAKIVSVSSGKELESLSVSVGSGFPTPSKELEVTTGQSSSMSGYDAGTGVAMPTVRVVYGNMVYSMQSDGPRKLKLGSRLGTLKQFIDVGSLTSVGGSFGLWWEEDEVSELDRYRKMFHAMAAHHFGIFTDKDLDSSWMPPGTIRLLCYTKLPPEMLLKSEQLTNQKGYVLLCQDLSIENTP